MKLRMFTVYDLKVELHSYPYPAVNAGVALRMFEEWVLNEEHPYGQHPEDYSLFESGVWNQVTGLPEPLDVKIFLCHAQDIVQAIHKSDELEPNPKMEIAT